MKNFAFFDVDTLWGDSARTCLLLRAHLRKMAPVYDRLNGLVDASGAPVVATLCLQSPPVDLDPEERWKWISHKADPSSWSDKLASANRFVLETKTLGTPDANITARSFDVFHAHPHASRFIEFTGIGKWFVFGRGEGCVGAVVDGLLALGCEVTLVEDAIAPGGRGNDDTVREFLQQCPAQRITVEQLSAWLPE